MADERPPTSGDASDFEAAAKALKAKAQKVETAVESATRATGKATDDVVRAIEADAKQEVRAAKEFVARKAKLEAERRKVAHRLRSSERRLEANEMSTPANQKRIVATYEKHKAHLARIDAALDKSYREAEREVRVASARKDERPSQGDAEEVRRVAREHGARLAAALDPEGRRRLAARQAPVSDPAEQARGQRELETLRRAPPPKPPPLPPPAPPGPPDDSDERRRLLQRLRNALARRVEAQETLARAAEQEARDAKVAREVTRRKAQAEIRAAASARLAAERLAARVGPEHEATRQRVEQERIERRITRAKERQAQQLIAGMRAAGAGQYPAPIGPAGPTPVEAMRAAGAGQYGETIGPRRPTRWERRDVNQARRLREASQASAQSKIDDSAATMAEATRLSNEYAAAQARLGSSMERTAISADLASQRFRKHGALTTEFIEAAAKGEVTMAELGYQLTSTVGKFAGWTAAASAVYGVVGAMQQVAEGAIAASSAIGLVGRVVTEEFDTGKLQTGLIDLSQQFNVPMQDVADAVYGAGKSFHDLPSAIKASESALFAMKVGELDSARATEALTAIVNGFKLQAGDLPSVFDTINQAQNRFGGNVGQLTQGVAKAGGQFRSAGGDYRELIAILTTGARLTGSTAEEVATAVGRSASVLRTPAGAARARAAGLDPSLDPLAILQQAQELGRGASPERVQELARAMVPSGGQFARIFVPLIQNAELLNEVLAETTPEKTKGSAQKELAKVLSQANEEIKKIANNLQQLGAALAQSGLLTPIMALVKGLNLAITGITDLVQLFSKVIPDPLKPVLATALELYAVLRLLRRFDIGGQIPAGGRTEALRQFISASPEQRSKRQVLQGIGAERRFLLDERERAGNRAAVAASRERSAAERHEAAKRTGDVDLIGRRNVALRRAAEQAADLAEEEADLRKLIDQNDQKRVDTLKNIRTGASPEQALAAAGGHYRTADVARPTTRGPVQIMAGTGSPRDVSRYIDEVEAMAQAQGRMVVTARGFQSAASKVGVTGRALGAAAVGASRAAHAASSGMRAGAAGFFRLGATMVGALSGLDLALIGILAAYEAYNQYKKEHEDNVAALNQKLHAQADPEKLREQVEGPKSLKEKFNERREFQFGIPGIVLGTQEQLRGRGAERLQKERAEALAREQAFGRQLSTGMVQQREQIESAIAATPKEEAAALDRALAELSQGYIAVFGQRDIDEAKARGDKKGEQDARAAVARLEEYRESLNARRNALALIGGALDEALAAAVDFKGLQAFIDQRAAVSELSGKRPGSAMGAAAVRAAQVYVEGGSQETAEYLKTIQAAEQTIISDAEQRLERALDMAKSPAARRRARRTFRSQVREDIGVDDIQDELGEIDSAQASRELRINRLKLKRQQGGPNIDPLTGKPRPGGLPQGLTPEEEAKLRALEEDFGKATKEERALRQDLRRKRKLLNDVERESKRAEFEEALALFEARTDVGAARQPAGARRIAYQLRRVGIEIARSIKEYGRNSKEVLQLISEQQQLQSSAVDQQLAAIQAAGDLAAAQAGTPAGEQRARAESLQKVLDFQKAHPEQYDPKVDLVQTRAQILENAKAKRDTADQEFRELLDARYDYLASLTDDPVKLARLEEQKANAVLARGGLSQAERYRAMADRNNARRQRENAVTTRRVEELDLQRDVGRMSDQAYLNGLEKLWRGMKKGTEAWREMRGKILRFRHDMEEGSEGFSLDVGNIRLPTAYEVHRAIREGRDARQRTVVNNSPTVNLNLAPGDDGSAVVRTLDNYLGTSARSALRASADIGV